MVKTELVQSKSTCRSIPQIYSGVAYAACRINNDKKTGPASEIYAGIETGFYSLDLVPSFIVDTFALPYTTYQQYKLGNIDIKSQ